MKAIETSGRRPARMPKVPPHELAAIFATSG